MDFNKLLEQAQKMQKDLERMNDELNVAQFEGSASNGLVKVTINGENKMLECEIDDSILNKDDKDMIQDLIVIAYNNAHEKAENVRNEKLNKATGGLNLPNF